MLQLTTRALLTFQHTPYLAVAWQPLQVVPRQRPQHCALARTVAPNQAVPTAVGKRESAALYELLPAVADGDVFQVYVA